MVLSLSSGRWLYANRSLFSSQNDASASSQPSCSFKVGGRGSGEFSTTVRCWRRVSKICVVNLGWPSCNLEITADSRCSLRSSVASQEAESIGLQTDENHVEERGEGSSDGRPGWPPPKIWKRRRGRRARNRYSEHLTSILRSLKEETDQDVGKVLDHWKSKLWRDREQSVILNEERSWSKALAIFSWFKMQEDYVPNIIHYNIMFNILGRAKQFQLLKELWDEMQGKEVFPTNISYTTLVAVYAKAGEEEQTRHWFEEMKMRKLEIDALPRKAAPFLWGESVSPDDAFPGFAGTVEACNALIDVYGTVGQFGLASRVFAEMINAGIAPDKVTFDTLIKVCGLSGRMEEAESIYRSMKASDIFPDLTTFNILLTLFAKEGKLEKVLEYFSKMKEMGVSPDRDSFYSLLGEFSHRNMMVEAEAVVQEMQELGITPGKLAIQDLAKMYSRLGYEEKVTKLSQRSVPWSEVIQIQNRSEDYQGLYGNFSKNYRPSTSKDVPEGRSDGV